MNTVQRNIAAVLGQHFKRQDAATPRNGPLARVREDQVRTVEDMVRVFTQQNPGFDAHSFRAVVVSYAL